VEDAALGAGEAGQAGALAAGAADVQLAQDAVADGIPRVLADAARVELDGLAGRVDVVLDALASLLRLIRGRWRDLAGWDRSRPRGFVGPLLRPGQFCPDGLGARQDQG